MTSSRGQSWASLLLWCRRCPWGTTQSLRRRERADQKVTDTMCALNLLAGHTSSQRLRRSELSSLDDDMAGRIVVIQRKN